MKNLNSGHVLIFFGIILGIIFFICFFSSLATGQNVGDRKTQTAVFGLQPVWSQLTSRDTFMKMKVLDYIACHSGDVVLFFNGVDGGSAEVQGFNPEDQILVLRHGGAEYLYKVGCHNRLKYIRVLKKPEPPPTTKLSPKPEPTSEREEEPQKPRKGYCDIDLCTGMIYHRHPRGETCTSYRQIGDCESTQSGYWLVSGGYQTSGGYGGYCPPPLRPRPRYW